MVLQSAVVTNVTVECGHQTRRCEWDHRERGEPFGYYRDARWSKVNDVPLYVSLDHPRSCKALCYSQQSIQSMSLGIIVFDFPVRNHCFKPFTDPGTRSTRSIGSAEISTAAQSNKGSRQKGCKRFLSNVGKSWSEVDHECTLQAHLPV